MNTAVIICEFNPLHTGHKRLIDYAKTIANNVVCVMSGNFTQRAMPACANKFRRAYHAAMAGADLVVELPTIFATAPAENFAIGGIAIAQHLQADCIVFGSECGNIHLLQNCLQQIDSEQTQQAIKNEMANGVSYPKAVANATGLDALNQPNNILAIEYLRAINKLHAKIIPFTIAREDNYNCAPQIYASSAALRKDTSLLKKYSFDYVLQDLDMSVEDRYCQLLPVLLSLATKERLHNIEGVTEGLENRIVRADKTHGYEEFIGQIKTKRYTRIKLQRILLNSILDITPQTVENFKTNPPLPKALAVNKKSSPLLQFTTKKSDDTTCRADNFYKAICSQPYHDKLIIVD